MSIVQICICNCSKTQLYQNSRIRKRKSFLEVSSMYISSLKYCFWLHSKHSWIKVLLIKLNLFSEQYVTVYYRTIVYYIRVSLSGSHSKYKDLNIIWNRKLNLCTGSRWKSTINKFYSTWNLDVCTCFMIFLHI